MKLFKPLFLILTVVAFSTAQNGPPHPVKSSELDTVSLPGQFWSATGNIDPVEKGNVISETYFEQGATVWSTTGGKITLEPYVGLGVYFDTKGYDYNNKLMPAIGVKLNKHFGGSQLGSGVVTVGTAFVDEHRFAGGQCARWMTYYAQYWFGWQPAAALKSRFPGSSWGEIGNVSPVEKDNYILLDYATQAFVLKRLGISKTSAVLPYAEITYGKDTKGYDWDNKIIEGGGIKLGIPKGGLYTELGAGYLYEHRPISGLTASGFKVSLNFSTQWGLFGRKAR